MSARQFYSCILASFGSKADGKFVEPDTFTLEGNAGGWTTIAAGEYYLIGAAGEVWQRNYQDDGTAIDWSAYTEYRATYTVYESSTNTATTYTAEAQTFALEVNADGNPTLRVSVGPDGDLQSGAARDLISKYVYALGGVVKKLWAGAGKILLDTTGITFYGDAMPLKWKDTVASDKLGASIVANAYDGNVGLEITANPDAEFASSGILLNASDDVGNSANFTLSVVDAQAFLQLYTTQLYLTPTTKDQLTGNANDYDLGNGIIFRLRSDAARNITGLANGFDGRLVMLCNFGNYNITIKHQNASSDAANRVLCSTAADIVLAPAQTLRFWYDASTARWRDW